MNEGKLYSSTSSTDAGKQSSARLDVLCCTIAVGSSVIRPVSKHPSLTIISLKGLKCNTENIKGGVKPFIPVMLICMFVLMIFVDVQSRRVHPLGHGTQKCSDSSSMRMICSAVTRSNRFDFIIYEWNHIKTGFRHSTSARVFLNGWVLDCWAPPRGVCCPKGSSRGLFRSTRVRGAAISRSRIATCLYCGATVVTVSSKLQIVLDGHIACSATLLSNKARTTA